MKTLLGTLNPKPLKPRLLTQNPTPIPLDPETHNQHLPQVAQEKTSLDTKLFVIGHDRAMFLPAVKIQKLMESGGPQV